jgi:hypothetical protein
MGRRGSRRFYEHLVQLGAERRERFHTPDRRLLLEFRLVGLAFVDMIDRHRQ